MVAGSSSCRARHSQGLNLTVGQQIGQRGQLGYATARPMARRRHRNARPAGLSSQQLEQAIADYRAGQSVARISATLGRSGAAVHRALRRASQRAPGQGSGARSACAPGARPRPRPARGKIPGVILGRKITDLEARLRRRPPLVIPARTPAERGRAWTARELEAIEYELRAGRFSSLSADDRAYAGWAGLSWPPAGAPSTASERPSGRQAGPRAEARGSPVFDASSGALARSITGMACGPVVNRPTPAARILGELRRHPALAQSIIKPRSSASQDSRKCDPRHISQSPAC